MHYSVLRGRKLVNSLSTMKLCNFPLIPLPYATCNGILERTFHLVACICEWINRRRQNIEKREMGHHKEKSKERKEKRQQEISLLRTIPYSDHQRLGFLSLLILGLWSLKNAEYETPVSFWNPNDRYQIPELDTPITPLLLSKWPLLCFWKPIHVTTYYGLS